MPDTRSIHVVNLGCAKNQVDAETLMEYLRQQGWQIVSSPEAATTIFINSCGFIEKAKEESIDTVLDYSLRFSEAAIVLGGCLAQRYPEGLAAELPEAQAIVGNRDLHALARHLAALLDDGVRLFVPEDGATGDLRRSRLLSLPGSAYVKVAEGCDKGCSFCAIPGIRGRLRSRPSGEIAREVADLFARDVQEITLVAQDLGSYRDHHGGVGLVALLRRLAPLGTDRWIRMLYLYPESISEELLAVIKETPALLPYFDIPFQHVDPEILGRMGRGGDAEGALDLVRKIRRIIPHAVIRSSLLVGFPGEGEDEFGRLVDFVRQAEIDWLGVFEFSPEEGTAAYSLHRGRARVSKAVRTRRRQAIEEVQLPIAHRRLSRFVGKTMEILIEELVEGEEMAIGRGYLHAPEVDGAVVVHAQDGRDRTLVPGTFLRCRITGRAGLDLQAVPQAPSRE